MAGRKSIYDTKIKSRFNEIKTWLEDGATERQVAESLGISYSSLNKYKIEKKEFMELLKNIDRSKIVSDLRGALLKRALGYDVKEEKTIVKQIIFDDPNLGELPAKVVRTEYVKKHIPPDVAAINLSLKNYDKDNWSNDWQQYGLKREELDLKKKLAEQNLWEE